MNSSLEPSALLKRAFETSEAPCAASVTGTGSSNSQTESASAASASAIVTAAPVAKRVKKEKDPNAPKRPLNAYFLFQREHRLHLKSTQPDLPHSESLKSMNEAWEKMSSTDRSRYENEAKALLEAFNKENKAYKESKDAGFEVTSPIVSESPVESPIKAPVESPVESDVEAPLPIFSPSSEAVDTPKKKKKKDKSNRESSHSQQN